MTWSSSLRWRALVGRCNLIELADADTDSPVFRQEVVEYLEGVAAGEGVYGVDMQTLCERAGWSIHAALNTLDMQERGTPEPVVEPEPEVTGQAEATVEWYSFYGDEHDSVLVADGEGSSCRSALSVNLTDAKNSDTLKQPCLSITTKLPLKSASAMPPTSWTSSVITYPSKDRAEITLGDAPGTMTPDQVCKSIPNGKPSNAGYATSAGMFSPSS